MMKYYHGLTIECHHFTKGYRNLLGFDVWWIAKTSQSPLIVANTTTLQLTKIPSDMEVAPRYKLLKLLTLLTLFTLLILLTWHTLSIWFALLTWFTMLTWLTTLAEGAEGHEGNERGQEGRGKRSNWTG